MTLEQLKKLLNEAARAARQSEFFVIGSQALHACDEIPAEALVSQECDLYPTGNPLAVAPLDAKLGRRSKFARKHGFYADVVTPEIATLPEGWRTRLKIMKIGKVRALCLDAHDLAVSKLAAGRLKDLELIAALIKQGLVRVATIRRLIERLPPHVPQGRLHERLEAVMAELQRPNRRR